MEAESWKSINQCFSPSSRFFYLYHLFFKILNSPDPHSFLSLQQSSSYEVRDPDQDIELNFKKSPHFFNILTLSGSRFQHPDPDQDPN